MQFSCSGTVVGWTVSGRSGSGTKFPNLQIWRRNDTNQYLYHATGQEIQIDAEGSTCETITQTCDQIFQCRLSRANRVSVQSGSDIIGVELPPLEDQAFELLFIAAPQSQYVWRQEITTSSLRIGSQDIIVRDALLLSLDVKSGNACALYK